MINIVKYSFINEDYQNYSFGFKLFVDYSLSFLTDAELLTTKVQLYECDVSNNNHMKLIKTLDLNDFDGTIIIENKKIVIDRIIYSKYLYHVKIINNESIVDESNVFLIDVNKTLPIPNIVYKQDSFFVEDNSGKCGFSLTFSNEHLQRKIYVLANKLYIYKCDISKINYKEELIDVIMCNSKNKFDLFYKINISKPIQFIVYVEDIFEKISNYPSIIYYNPKF